MSPAEDNPGLALNPTLLEGHRHANVHGKVSNISDENVLVEQCRAQSRTAQKTMYEKYSGRMLTVCYRYLKNEDDAMEVLNNAFMKVFSKITQYKAEGSLEGWIKRIVINSAIDFVRGNKTYKKKFVLTDEFSYYGAPRDEDDIADDLPEDNPIMSTEQVFELVKELPPATRVVFNLYVVDEFTHHEIAEHLKISEGTSKWHLSNARKILKEKITRVMVSENKHFSHG
jgi:RNA polymerase sigma-70 factor (ECF subfamily)